MVKKRYVGVEDLDVDEKTDVQIYVSPAECDYKAATDTWAQDITANILSQKITGSGANNAEVFIPINAKGKTTASSNRGFKITKVEILYKVTTADISSVDAELYRIVVNASTNVVSTTNITNTTSGFTGTAGASYRGTLTVASANQEWGYNTATTEGYRAKFSFTLANTSIVNFYGAIVTITDKPF